MTRLLLFKEGDRTTLWDFLSIYSWSEPISVCCWLLRSLNKWNVKSILIGQKFCYCRKRIYSTSHFYTKQRIFKWVISFNWDTKEVWCDFNFMETALHKIKPWKHTCLFFNNQSNALFHSGDLNYQRCNKGFWKL